MAIENSSKTSITQQFDSYKPSKAILVWACAATAAATMIVGFNWGGWVTGGTSRTAAAAAADIARGELASAICVERFKRRAGRGRKTDRVQGNHRRLQEASIRRGRRLGDDAGPDRT